MHGAGSVVINVILKSVLADERALDRLAATALVLRPQATEPRRLAALIETARCPILLLPDTPPDPR